MFCQPILLASMPINLNTHRIRLTVLLIASIKLPAEVDQESTVPGVVE